MTKPKAQRLTYHWKADRVIRHQGCTRLGCSYRSLPLNTNRVRITPEAAFQLAHLAPKPGRAQNEVMKLIGENRLTFPRFVSGLLQAHSL